MGKVLDQYRSLVESGALEPDPAQAKAASQLDCLAKQLKRSGSGLFGAATPQKGLYLWGGVGRGKSMLMDIFFNKAPVKFKRRVHFHAFMRDVHASLARWRAMDDAGRRKSPWRIKRDDGNALAPVAKEIAASARLLCFDEFQVTQIADAMILGRLFEGLFARGVTVVTTSNRAPDDLYKDGLNRHLFEPFIDELKQGCDVFELTASRDYRLEQLTRMGVWHAPLEKVAHEAMDNAWDELVLGAEPCRTALEVQGRQVDVPRTGAGVARFTFEELCAQPLGASDYLAIAAEFHTVMIDGIPVMTPERQSEALRFVALIDALYETGTKLVASAVGEPDTLYEKGTGSFEFQRTASRLYEMRSKAYLEKTRNIPMK